MPTMMGNLKYAVRRDGTADGFTYDTNNQLLSFRRNGTLSGGVVTGGTLTSYTFDASGNRKTAGSTAYGAANSLNQYTTIDGLSVTYGGNGNFVNYGLSSYTYDAMNRLTVASEAGGASASFYYDGMNRQVARVENGITTYSLYDGWNLVAEYDSNGTLINRWTYAGNDLTRRIGQFGTLYFQPDASGSTRYLTNAAGTIVERYTYDAYGAPTFYDGNNVVRNPNETAYAVNDLLNGQHWYPDLGIYDLRNRAYRADIGRFLQPDPIGFAGDPANLYRYVGNNSVNLSDPFGLTYWYGLEGMGAPSRPGQFLKGLGAFGLGNVSIFIGAASSTTGIGTAFGVLAITSGVTEFGYGIENMVASYSDSPAAIAAVGHPKGIGEVAGRAFAGKQGQIYGGLIDSTLSVMTNGPRAASGEIVDLLEAGKSSLEFADAFYDAQEYQQQRYIMSLIPNHAILWSSTSTDGTPFLTGDTWNFPMTIDASTRDSENARGFSSGLSLMGFVPATSFRPSDGFGGGGGLGPPGGLEKAVWDNMHKKGK